MKIVTAEQMRNLEEKADLLGMPPAALMQNAGRSLADALEQYNGSLTSKRILVLVGPGNNGGDGLVAARHLHYHKAMPFIYIWKRQKSEDINLTLAKELNIPIINPNDDQNFSELAILVNWSDIIIDALLGTGKARPIEGELKQLLETVRINRRPGQTIVALDLPSGLDADDGSADPSTLPADLTVTLGYAKMGLFLPPGADLVGKIAVADIGIPQSAETAELKYPANLINAKIIADILPSRKASGHKGTFGKTIVCGGSPLYIGAPCLSALAAIRTGAGIVTLAIPESIHQTTAVKVTEATFLPLPNDSEGYIHPTAAEKLTEKISQVSVWALGPGLGLNKSISEFMKSLFQIISADEKLRKITLVLDADGLNNLVSIPDWWKILPDETIMTPHPAELGRLMGQKSPAEIQSDRLGWSSKAATSWQKIVILKGANTIIAEPDGNLSLNPGANPALATGGTGDVLTGIIAGLISQGLSPANAAKAGVYLHYQTALNWQKHKTSRLAASDLIDLIPETLDQIAVSKNNTAGLNFI